MGPEQIVAVTVVAITARKRGGRATAFLHATPARTPTCPTPTTHTRLTRTIRTRLTATTHTTRTRLTATTRTTRTHLTATTRTRLTATTRTTRTLTRLSATPYSGSIAIATHAVSGASLSSQQNQSWLHAIVA